MKLTPISINLRDYPVEIHDYFHNSNLFDSSSSPEARVIFIDKDGGYFLKSAPKGTLEREAVMTKYFHSKSLAAEVLFYSSDERDWLLTSKLPGDDCTENKYLENPNRLCDLFGERLAILHSEDFSDCPIQNYTRLYLEKAEENRSRDTFDKTHFPDSFGYSCAEEAWSVVQKHSHLLKADTLLHGDYCLPNIILNNWSFSGFIDLDNAGVGDRHIDLFWGIWTLEFNLKTDKYRQRFIDAYGRSRVDEEVLRVVGAVEVFG